MEPQNVENRSSTLSDEKETDQPAAVEQDYSSDDTNDYKRMEKRILRKVDLHLIIPLWATFIVGFSDRINIGNVAVLGMLKDLRLKGDQFNMVLQAFFITYIVFDVPTNLLLKHSRPSLLISGLSLGWGISSLCQGLVKNFAGLVACRLFVGAFEAGFTPAAIYLMSTYYRRHEYQFRFNLMWSGGVMAGVVSGLLAYAINNMNGVAGLEGWRWVLLLEGIMACILAVLGVFTLADWPHQARFLTPAEREFWIQRSQFEARGVANMDRFDKNAMIRILKDWKIWCGAVMYLGVGTSGYATALFVPSILTTLGYTGVQSQVQSIPIWVVTTACTLAAGLISDKAKHRYGFIMFGLLFALIGYAILICQGPQPAGKDLHVGLALKVRYMAVFFVAIGTHMAQPICLIWLVNNLGGSYKRGIGSAIQVLFGSIAGIIASDSFETKDAPRYFSGYGTVMGLLGLCGVFSSIFAYGLAVENRKRQRGERDYRLGWSDCDNLGDDHPLFRFTL